MFKTNWKWWLTPFLYLLAVWLIFILQHFIDITEPYALYPHRTTHLKGIFTAVFLHGSLVHIASNSLPLAICLLSLFYFYRDISLSVLVICHLFTGALMWLFARPAYHIGASGLVYALVLFLLTSGFIRNNKQLKYLALAVLSIQSGLLWGLVPQGNNISWEGHLFGAITGLVTAIVFRNQGPLPDKKFHWHDEDGHQHGNHRQQDDEYRQFGQ